ncbi:MAG: hypothetical protein ABEJ70_08445 [Halobacteriaceae archaeon]
MDRRTFLASLTATGAAGLAGCAGGSDGGGSTPTLGTETTTATTSDGALFETTTTTTVVDWDSPDLSISGFPPTSLNYELYTRRAVDPKQLFGSHLGGEGGLQADPSEWPSDLTRLGLLSNVAFDFSGIEEYETVYGAEQAYALRKRTGETVTEHDVDGHGTWLVLDRRPDGTRPLNDDTIWAGMTQVENLVLYSSVSERDYDDPESAIVSSIERGTDVEDWDSTYFNPYIVALADHYRSAVEYDPVTAETSESATFAVPREEFDESDAASVFRDDLEIRFDSVESVDEWYVGRDSYTGFDVSGPSSHAPFLPNSRQWHEILRQTDPESDPLYVDAQMVALDSVQRATDVFRKRFAVGPESNWSFADSFDDADSATFYVTRNDDGTVVADHVWGYMQGNEYAFKDRDDHGSIGRTILSGNVVIDIWWKVDT